MPTLDQLVVATTLSGAEKSWRLERLEALGDAILKFVVTLGVFVNRSLTKMLVELGLIRVNQETLTLIL